ncbi:MBL fold metallo-hydrolase [Marinospirillum perlucidum]|uniref:MBL fold metallo-hydrolase n=1 Tax=Marinospirillum perlucidum TaxID=1982602 RepID=UPI001C49BC30|nr:MBL fold metallo-hydrolase [Marinospirillum perlucidum]
MKVVYWILAIVGIACLGVLLYLHHPKFGDLPEGEALVAIEASPHYEEGTFRNLIPTPMFAGDKTFLQVLTENLASSNEGLTPEEALPTWATELDALDPNKNLVVWLGHSSFFIQINGLRLLLDPVLSDQAAPLGFLNPAYAGTNLFSAPKLPAIDALLISHDHWDHLDYPSIRDLEPKVEQVLAPLGIGSYLRGWGYSEERIREGDWFDHFDLGREVRVHLIPARHYSGRLLTRNKTLWAGFILETPELRLLFSGDSGYGPHFNELGRHFNGFDFVALDSGQYDERWPYIHMNPEEAATAAENLGARAMMPAHVGRFTLARHPWQEPFQRLVEASRDKPYKLVTPRIGQVLFLDQLEQTPLDRWWQ